VLSRAHGVHARRFHLNRESKTAESVSASERERERERERGTSRFSDERGSRRGTACYRDAISAGRKNIHICEHIGTRARDCDYRCCNLVTYHLG